jgi:hypothetical protein
VKEEWVGEKKKMERSIIRANKKMEPTLKVLEMIKSSDNPVP